MKERFEGDANRKNRVDALLRQKLVAGDSGLAEELADLIEVMEVPDGAALIHQGKSDTDMYFILAGQFALVINRRTINHRVKNDHIGEMSAIEPSLARSASLVADGVTVVGKLTAAQLDEVAERYPRVWRQLAKEYAQRLYQRNAQVRAPRDTIRVFIISSVEALDIAREVQNQLGHDFVVNVWTNGVFRASHYNIENLEKVLEDSDFAIAIAQPDDLTQIRGEESLTPRDNVVFELGLFIGRIQRQRTFLLEPRGDAVKLPSDLAGITTLGYRHGEKKDLPASLASACNQIRDIINEYGPRD